MSAGLTGRLKQLFRERATPEREAALAEIVGRLQEAGLADRALGPGDPAPDFLLPNAEGRLVAFSDLVGAGPVILSFFRGGWCPYCALTMRAMEEALPRFTEAGARFAAIWPERGRFAKAAKRERGLQYELLIDMDHAVALQYGVAFAVPPLYREALERAGLDIELRQGNRLWLLPVPASFVVSQDGVIRAAFVDPDFTTRAEPEAILEVLRVTGPNIP